MGPYLSESVKKASKGLQTAFIRNFGDDFAISEVNGPKRSETVKAEFKSDFSKPGLTLTNGWNFLIEKLVLDGFNRDELRDLFSQPEVVFDPSPMGSKMRALYATKLRVQSIRPIQERLAELGYEPGSADGKMGGKTRRAIMAFQHVHGLPIDGKPTQKLFQSIQNERRKAPPNIKHLDLPTKVAPRVYKSVLRPERINEAKDFWVNRN